MESAELGISSGVDFSLHINGHERLAHLAAGQLERRRGCSGLVLDSVGTPLRMDFPILRAEFPRRGLRREPAVVDDDRCDDGRLLLDFFFSRVVVDSVYRMGRLRVLLELSDLA